MRSAGQPSDVGQTQFLIWIAQQQRQDLTLLLRAEDGEQRRRWSSIHELKNPLHFVEVLPAAVHMLSPTGLGQFSRNACRDSGFVVVAGLDDD